MSPIDLLYKYGIASSQILHVVATAKVATENGGVMLLGVFLLQDGAGLFLSDAREEGGPFSTHPDIPSGEKDHFRFHYIHPCPTEWEDFRILVAEDRRALGVPADGPILAAMPAGGLG